MRLVCGLSVSLFFVSGCGAAEPPLPGPLSPEVHECQSYQPTVRSSTIGGQYNSRTDERPGIIRAPEDPGGGYIEFVLSTESSSLSPGIIVTAVGDDAGAILADNAVATADPTVLRGGFSAAPGQAYDLTFTQGLGAPAAEYPVHFDLDWTFTGTMDCYENNDSAAEAKQVPVGTAIEAHALAGYTRNRLDPEPYVDWYRLVLNRAADVEAELSVPPGQHRMRIRFWEEDGLSALGGDAATRRGEAFATSQSLEAGTYLLTVEVAEPERADFLRDLPEPTFWGQPYTVDLREKP